MEVTPQPLAPCSFRSIWLLFWKFSEVT